jgi:glycerol-3-phosphate dehydrogenase
MQPDHAPAAEEPVADIDAGDVLIVGAGAVGVVAATRYVEAGRRVTLVDGDGIAARQSAHSHGLVHRGACYPRQITPDFAAELRAGGHAWTPILESVDAEPTSLDISLLFTDPFAARAAARAWSASGVEFTDVAPPPRGASERIVRAFSAPEASYDFAKVLAELAGRLPAGVFHRARVVAVEASRGRVQGMLARVGSQLVRMRAGQYLMAAGCGIEPLLRSAQWHRGRLVHRRSFMLVLSSPELPPVSIVAPEVAGDGLFIIARPGERGATVWLASNFWSQHPLTPSSDTAACLWVQGVLDVLGKYTTALDCAGLHTGAYEADKEEYRDQPSVLRSFDVDTFGTDNLAVVTPTKITLAVLAADSAIDQLSRMSSAPHAGESPATLGGPTQLRRPRERWRATPTLRFDDLCAELERHSASGWLLRESG